MGCFRDFITGFLATLIVVGGAAGLILYLVR